MSGAAICDISPGLADIEDIIGADDVTPRERYNNKPVPVPKVRKPKKTKHEVSLVEIQSVLSSQTRDVRRETCQKSKCVF